MEKIKIIDLLIGIKNKKYDELKTKFMLDGKQYVFDDFLTDFVINSNTLNWEVEIIEEDKKIKKISKSYNIRILDLDKPHTIKDYDMEQLIEMVQDIYEKQDEIIDYINKEEK